MNLVTVNAFADNNILISSSHLRQFISGILFSFCISVLWKERCRDERNSQWTYT